MHVVLCLGILLCTVSVDAGAGKILTEEDKKEIAKMHEYQANATKVKAARLNVKLVQKFNSDPLPEQRLFEDVSLEDLCVEHKDQCLGSANIPSLFSAVPAKKLAQCLVQKTMSTVMCSVFCYLHRRDDFIAQNRSVITDWGAINMCGGQNEYFSMLELKSKNGIKTEADLDDWRFTIVTREPVDRFLSGFVDRCVRLRDPCEGCGMNMTCFLEKEYARLSTFGKTTNFQMSLEDIHVMPQSWRCKLEEHHSRYTFIRYSNQPEKLLLKQLREVLEERDVDEEDIEYIEKSITNGRTAHSTRESAARRYLERRLRNSPYLMEFIVRMFYVDYTTLEYPLPEF